MRLPETAVRRPVTTIMIFAALTLLGCVAFFKLNLDMLPDIEPPAVSVITPYPGASATDVESEVTKYMEDQLSTTPNLDTLESTSKDNISVVNCTFEWGTDLDVAVNDIREKIDLAKPDLADGADTPYIFKFSSSMIPVMVLTVTARESGRDLYRIVDKQIADPLKRIPGVGAVVYIGGKERQINVHFDRQKIEAYHLSITQIRNVMAAENLNLPVGTVEVGRNELQMRVAGRYADATEIGNTVIGASGDALVRLRDVADITDSYSDPQQWSWSGNAEDAIAVVIQKQSGSNTVNVADAVKARLESLKDEIPADMTVYEIMDTSRNIRAMIESLSESAIVGGVLVVVICFLFLRRLRTSLVVTLSIPLSMVAAFVGLYAMGYTINIISLMSLAIAVGMVVDDAIVVLENIVRHVDEGEEPAEAAVKGASEVGLAVAASTLTIVAVFAPLMLVKGLAGIIFGQLAFIILIAILASLFISLTLTPMAASRLLRPRSEARSSRLFVASERILTGLEGMYAKALTWTLEHRKTSLAFIILVFVGSLALVPLVGSEFMPEMDSGEVGVNIEMRQGARAEITAEATTQMVRAFHEVPEMQAVYGMAGQSEGGELSAVGMEEGTNIGAVSGRLVDKEKRSRSAKEIAAEMRKKVENIPGVVKYSVSAVSAMSKVFMGGGHPITIEILGHDIDVTDRVAEEVRAVVEKTPGTVDVSVSRKQPRPEVVVSLDRDKASSMGVNVALVADALRTNYYGFNTSKFRADGDDFDIELRLKEDQRQSIEEIGETPITTMTGQVIKLRNVASITQEYGPVEIERKNRVRVTKVVAGIEGRVLGDVADDIKAGMAGLDIPPGVTIEWGGEVDEQSETFADLFLLLILGIILVYMVMAGEFEDFVDPFIIMFSLPFAFIGCIWAFVLSGTALNMMSFIGVIMLMGIVVKNAIVLIDYTQQLRERGMGLKEAIINGGRTRLRPVLMTSLTTIFGMVPLAMSHGEGAEMWNALGFTVIGGLVLSGLVTLILVPIIYSLVHQRGERRRLTS